MTTTMLERPRVKITLADRCDATANGAEAAEFAVTFHEGQEPLLLCGHHFRAHAAKIFALNPFDVTEKE
jgi:hypothetical protein